MPERMSDGGARRSVLGRGSPARQVVLILLAYVVVGAIAGAVWEWIWTPPVHIIRNHQVYYASYASLRGVFTGTGLYALVGAVASALLAVAVCLLTRRRELVTLASVLV